MGRNRKTPTKKKVLLSDFREAVRISGVLSSGEQSKGSVNEDCLDVGVKVLESLDANSGQSTSGREVVSQVSAEDNLDLSIHGGLDSPADESGSAAIGSSLGLQAVSDECLGLEDRAAMVERKEAVAVAPTMVRGPGGGGGFAKAVVRASRSMQIRVGGLGPLPDRRMGKHAVPIGPARGPPLKALRQIGASVGSVAAGVKGQMDGAVLSSSVMGVGLSVSQLGSGPTNGLLSEVAGGSSGLNGPKVHFHAGGLQSSVVGGPKVAGDVKSWADLFGTKSSSSSKLVFLPPKVVNGRRVVVPSDDIVNEGINLWRCSLVGQFVDSRVPFPVLARLVNRIWGHLEEPSITMLENGLIIFQFRQVASCDWILSNGPWHIGGKPLLLRKWFPGKQRKSWNFPRNATAFLGRKNEMRPNF